MVITGPGTFTDELPLSSISLVSRRGGYNACTYVHHCVILSKVIYVTLQSVIESGWKAIRIGALGTNLGISKSDSST